MAERPIVAPLYIAPGGDGDAMGPEGRAQHNMVKMYGFMTHVAGVLANHADCLDQAELEDDNVGRLLRARALEFNAVKVSLE